MGRTVDCVDGKGNLNHEDCVAGGNHVVVAPQAKRDIHRDENDVDEHPCLLDRWRDVSTHSA